MEEQSPKPASTPTGAVFLSYASEDASAAERIASALRAAGIEVWFDQSELRGGDAWDRQIREQIHDCRLFIALISANSEARDEGYFRREWGLAVDRTRDMDEKKAFLLPVVIDDTVERNARVPEKFHAIQWTRLPGGVTQPEFAARIKRLLSADPPTTAKLPAGGASGSSPIPLMTRWPSPLRRALPVAVALLVLAAMTYLLVNQPWISKPAGSPVTSTSSPTPSAAFNPPPHSIAVLPFVNFSGDKEQDYFSDGLSEELLNSLSRINELQVAARTSSFYFKGEHADLSTIAHKLNVASVLEGSVRRSGNTIRITAQLNNAVTGFHLWSQTYDRDLSNVLQLQTEIANAVASALKVRLLGDVGATIEVGGTRNGAAYDTYLRAAGAYLNQRIGSDLEKSIADYEEAVRLDSHFALAYAGLSIALNSYATFYAHGAAKRDFDRRARLSALTAVELAPDLGEGHLALALVHGKSLDLKRANEEFERAMALAPGNARVLRDYGAFAVGMGHTEAGIAAARRAVALDPLNANSYGYLGETLRVARRYDEALVAYQDALSLEPQGLTLSGRAYVYYAAGNFEKMRSICEGLPEGVMEASTQSCLALAYHKLGRHADAEAALAREESLQGKAGALDYALIYAQWGNIPKALSWLETALRFRNEDLAGLKTEPLLDPLRNEPRFQAVMRELKFPD